MRRKEIIAAGIRIILLVLMFMPLDTSAAETPEPKQPNRPKIGVVFGGGGAKGAAHIGVLKVLEELRIPVDYVAGTSMGAIVGALYASGLSAAELEQVITSIDWKDVFSGDPARQDIDFRRKREDYTILSGLAVGIKDGKLALPKGLIKDQKVNVLFEMLMLHTADTTDFDKLPIPYRAIASDLETGEMVVLRSGRLADAARASMSVPGAFPPIELDGRLLIDGGIVRNVPVDIVRGMGADIIICVDVGKPLATRKDLARPGPIMNQMLDIMMNKNVADQIKTLGPKDVYINPVLGELGSGDFDKAAEIAAIGEEAARLKLDSLKRYSVSDAEYAAFKAHHHAEQVKEVKINSIAIEMESTSKISSEVVANKLSIKPGETVNIDRLKEEAGIVYGTGDFERVDLQVKRQRDGYELVVKARERSWGPNYLRFGFAVESDFKGMSRYNMLFDYTRRWVNSLGAEWKVQIDIGTPSGVYSEFYQPFTTKGLFFVSPYVRYKREPYTVFSGDRRVAEFDVTQYLAGIDLGFQPGRYGEARIGVQYGEFRADQRIGDINVPRDTVARGAIIARGILDQLDNVNFPNKGYKANFNAISSLEGLGSDDNYNKVEASIGGAFTFRKQTILAQVKAGSHIGNEIPYYDSFNLGGFLNLSGLTANQLHGQHMAFGKVISYHKIGESFIGSLYFGGSIEAGNVWQKDFDLGDIEVAGSVFVGYDTLLGPLYIGLGHAGEGRTAGYFYLGRAF